MNIKAMFLTCLFIGSALLGLFFCSKIKAGQSSKATSPVREVKKAKKADIKYFTTNKAGEGTVTYYWNLNAKVEGKKHEISKDEQAMSIFEVLDFDEDGYEDALLRVAPCFMGNACLDSYMFCSYSKNGTFKLSETFGENASKPIIEKWNGKNCVKIESRSLTGMEASTEWYILKNGKAVRVEYKKRTPMKSVAELLPSDCTDEGGLTQHSGKKIYFDIDGDGAKDYIHGTYWMRWDLIGDWQIVFANGKKYKGERSVHRVGILSTKTNGVNNIVCDFDDVMTWNGRKYVYKNK